MTKTVTCVFCGTSTITNQSRKRFCSASCKQRHRRKTNPIENRDKMRAWRAKNPERTREIARASAKRQWLRDPEKFRRANRERYRQKREVILANKRRRDYGLEHDEYLAMLAAQEGCCAICRDPASETLYVDHNHTTGRIRGLLCRTCNLAIGYIHDKPSVALAMQQYLLRMDGDSE